MGKLRERTMVLGEGETEFYYFNSLKDVFKGLTIKPDCPKHTSIKELQSKIKKGIDEEYDYIYCVIDMDTKENQTERSQYERLKRQFQKPKKKNKCVVKFFETHRCTELFFFFYFKFTSRGYADQKELLEDLNRCCDYHKNIKFFKNCKGLHSYFEKNGGSLDKAIANAERSIQERNEEGRNYTYSELGSLMNELYCKKNNG